MSRPPAENNEPMPQRGVRAPKPASREKASAARDGTRSLKIAIEVSAGGALSSRDIAECLSLLRAGGAVNPRITAEDLPQAVLIAVQRADGHIIAVGAIKQRRPVYARGMSTKSGFPFDERLHELGYLAVHETYRGRGLSKALVRRLLAEFAERPLFATTGEEKMKRTLSGVGFIKEGREWPGKKGVLSLWLISAPVVDSPG